jgi:hypothetical protein
LWLRILLGAGFDSLASKWRKSIIVPHDNVPLISLQEYVYRQIPKKSLSTQVSDLLGTHECVSR